MNDNMEGRGLISGGGKPHGKNLIGLHGQPRAKILWKTGTLFRTRGNSERMRKGMVLTLACCRGQIGKWLIYQRPQP